MQDDEVEDGETSEPGWRDRLWAVGAAAGRLFQTRKAIFQEELAEKGAQLAGALAGVFVALTFAVIAGLLLAALIASLLSRLFGSTTLGILATLVLYLGVAAAAASVAWKKLSQLRPLEFPATGREIDRDFDAVARAAGIGESDRREARAADTARDGAPLEETAEEIEARLREGAG